MSDNRERLYHVTFKYLRARAKNPVLREFCVLAYSSDRAIVCCENFLELGNFGRSEETRHQWAFVSCGTQMSGTVYELKPK